MLLGLDFDNTLVSYDKLFYKLALEKNLIEESLPESKTEVRNYLRDKGKDDEFTLLQGEVYGLRILEAEPAEGMIKALREINQLGIAMVLVSHKTKTPYKGPAYDLHQAAWQWLMKYSFFEEDGLGWSRDQVFFEESKDAKIRRIEQIGCTHYIDDLTDILEKIPNRIKRILYDPGKKKSKEELSKKELIRLASWENLKETIKC